MRERALNSTVLPGNIGQDRSARRLRLRHGFESKPAIRAKKAALRDASLRMKKTRTLKAPSAEAVCCSLLLFKNEFFPVLLVDHSGLHDEVNLAHEVDVLQRVPFDGDDIRSLAGGNAA